MYFDLIHAFQTPHMYVRPHTYILDPMYMILDPIHIFWTPYMNFRPHMCSLDPLNSFEMIVLYQSSFSNELNGSPADLVPTGAPRS